MKSFNKFTRFAPAANSSLEALVMVACVSITAGFTARAGEITWANTATPWSTASNWIGGTAPADSLTPAQLSGGIGQSPVTNLRFERDAKPLHATWITGFVELHPCEPDAL